MNKHIEFGNTLATTMQYRPGPAPKAGTPFKDVLNAYFQDTGEKLIKNASTPPQEATAPPKLKFVGRTSKEQPTVSQLLLDHTEYKDKGWEIIFSENNEQKPFTQIPLGTPVYYNPENSELSWPSAKEQLAASTVKQAAPLSTGSTAENARTGEQTPLPQQSVALGSISDSYPTVSHLLNAHDDFYAKTWNILASNANKEKNFAEVPRNAEIRINPLTQEISWSTAHPSNKVEVTKTTNFAQEKLQAMSPAPELQNITSTQKTAVLLGTLNDSQPTVSHLIKNHPQFASSTWELLANPVNHNKSFDRIPANTEIFLNQATQEISWRGSERNEVSELLAKANPIPTAASSNLNEAVQPLMGRPYEEIDCYALLIRGLRKMGIPYMGKDGLRNTLTGMAKAKGLPSNAYLNGEGIIEATGKQVFSQSFNRVNNWTEQAGKAYREMEQYLQKGQILSFSTHTRGHTGIVSKHNNQWTFINSGKMDNHVDQATTPEEVGEENLLGEISNWFKIADENKESLVVTLGQLEEDKIRSAFQPKFRLSQRF